MQIQQVIGFEWDDGTKTSAKNTVFLFPILNPLFTEPYTFFLTLPIHKANNAISHWVRSTKNGLFLLLLPCDNAKVKPTSGLLAHATCTERRFNTMKKKLPNLTTDKEAEDFIGTADLTKYDLSGLTPVRFEFQPKERSITMRLSEPLLEAIKEEAERSGIPYQRFIRQTLENAVHQLQAH